jgi:hypothetical protein
MPLNLINLIRALVAVPVSFRSNCVCSSMYRYLFLSWVDLVFHRVLRAKTGSSYLTRYTTRQYIKFLKCFFCYTDCTACAITWWLYGLKVNGRVPPEPNCSFINRL